MKTLIIVSMAVLACAYAMPPKMLDSLASLSLEDKQKVLGVIEKMDAMTEEERFNRFNSKFGKMQTKFESMTPEQRQSLVAHIKQKLPVTLRTSVDQLSDEDKAKIMSKVHKYNAMPIDERKVVVQHIHNAHLEAVPVLSASVPHKMTTEEKQKIRDVMQKIDSMTDEERFNAFDSKFNDIYSQFEAAAPGEHTALANSLKVKLPAPIRAKLDQLTEEQKLKLRAKIEKYHEMTPEERQAVVSKIHAMHVAKMSEKRDHVLHQRFPDGAMAYNVVEVLRPAPGRPQFGDMTPEEIDQLRQQHNGRPRFPAGEPRPSPAAVGYIDNVENIREPADDIMMNDQWVRDLAVNKRKPRPVPE